MSVGAKRFLALFLAFLLGFLSCIGAIAGAAYFAYAKVSVEWLENRGVHTGLTPYLDPNAEKPLFGMSLSQLQQDLTSQFVRSMSIGTLLERYGVILPDSVDRYIPDAVMEMTVQTALSADGVSYIIENTQLGFVLQFLPAGTLSEPAIAVLEDKSLQLVKDGDMYGLLTGVKLGYLAGVEYIGISSGYQPIYQDPAHPTVIELLSELDMGDMVDALATGESMALLLRETVPDLKLVRLLDSALSLPEDDPLYTILKEKTMADVIHPDGTFDSDLLLGDVYIGELMGYEADAEGNWFKPGGFPVDAAMNKLSGLKLQQFLDGDVIIEDILGDVYVGELMKYDKVETVLDDGTVEIHFEKDGKPLDSLTATFAELMVSELTGDDFDAKETVSTIYAGDALGYYLNEEDGVWYEDEEFSKPLEGAVMSIAGKTIGELGDSMNTMPVGELVGYVKIDGVWYEYYTDETDNKPVTGIMKALMDTPINSMNERVAGMTVAEVMGYVYYCDTPDCPDHEHHRPADADHPAGWYAEAADGTVTPVSGVMRVLADAKVNTINDTVDTLLLGDVMGYYYNEADGRWYEDAGFTTVAEGLTASFADLTVNEMQDRDKVSEAVQNLLIGDALGYVKVDGVWYESYTDENDNIPASGVLAFLSDYRVSELDTALDETKMGDLLGYTERDGVWYDGDQPASGILGALANTAVNDLASDVDHVFLGEAMGYTCYCEGGADCALHAGRCKLPDEAHPVPGWYDGETPVDGMMSSLAELQVKDLSDSGAIVDALSGVKAGEVMGYSYNEADGEWYEDELYTVRATGVLAIVADTPVGEIGERVSQMKVGEIMGYFYNETDSMWYEDETCTVEMDGLLVLVADANVNEMDTAVNDAFKNATMGQLVDAGILFADADGNVDQEKVEKLTAVFDGDEDSWRALSISEFVNAMLDKVPAP